MFGQATSKQPYFFKNSKFSPRRVFFLAKERLSRQNEVKTNQNEHLTSYG